MRNLLPNRQALLQNIISLILPVDLGDEVRGRLENYLCDFRKLWLIYINEQENERLMKEMKNESLYAIYWSHQKSREDDGAMG
jgi:hypothetical protein